MPAVVRSAAKPAKASDAAAAATKNPKRTAHMNAPARPDGYSADDVARHCAKDDAWVIVGDGVYDITEWIPRHPGGSIPLVQYAGRDMTDAFRAYHSPNGKAAKTLNAYRIGDFTGAGSRAGSECESPKDHLATASGDSVGSVASSDAAAPHVAAFRTLVAGLEGEFRTDYRHYYKLFACLAALFAASVWCVVGEGHGVWTHMLGAVLLGMFWQQTMFIGHDAGHGAITHNHAKDFFIGLIVGNLCNGVGITWWTTTHNVHHCACNSVECDPDLQHMPVFAVSEKYFKSVYSLYHRRRMKFDRIAKFFVRVQHYTFYPIMAVARINLYLQTLIFLVKAERVRSRPVEFLAIGVFFAWLSALIAQLPEGHRVPFFFLSHAVAGIIHVQICLSHFSRDVFEGRPEHDEWVSMQLSGTMDIDCPWWLDWFHGGLQFQTEHHLCPRVPRHKLRTFRENVIKPFAKKNGLELHSVGFWAANAEVFRTLKLAAKESRWATHFAAASHL